MNVLGISDDMEKNLLLFKKLEEFTCVLANSIEIQELPGWRRLQVCLVWCVCPDRH